MKLAWITLGAGLSIGTAFGTVVQLPELAARQNFIERCLGNTHDAIEAAHMWEHNSDAFEKAARDWKEIAEKRAAHIFIGPPG